MSAAGETLDCRQFNVSSSPDTLKCRHFNPSR